MPPMRSIRLAAPLIAVTVSALVVGAAGADRKAAPSERKAIAKDLYDDVPRKVADDLDVDCF